MYAKFLQVRFCYTVSFLQLFDPFLNHRFENFYWIYGIMSFIKVNVS